MDKHAVVGLVLIFVIIVVFSILNRPSEAELARLQAQRDSLAALERIQDSAERVAHRANATGEGAEALLPAASPFLWAMDSASTPSEEELNREYLLENDRVRISLRALGAQIVQAQLRGYKTYGGDSLNLFTQGKHDQFSFRFWTADRAVHTSELYFTPRLEGSKLQALSTGDTARLIFEVKRPDSAGVLRYTYSLAHGSYEVGLRVDFENLQQQVVATQQFIDLLWQMETPKQEKGVKKELEYTKLAYYLQNGDYEEAPMRDPAKPKPVETKDRVEWVAYKQQFFSMILRTHTPFLQSEMHAIRGGGDPYLASFSSTFMLPFDGGHDDHYDFSIYLGPNHYKTLKHYDAHYERVVPLGGWLVGWINRYVVINVFDWLNSFVSSYGLIILILTVFIKLVIFPLTYRSYTSQAKMRALKPMIDRVNERYPGNDDALKKQQAVMDIYRRAGVSPMGGCLPMLIQFPILVAMFRFFPASIELRQQPFLWADDLSSYDSIVDLPFTIPYYGDHVSLFTLLMAVAIFASSLMSMKQTAQAAPQMKGMRFMMLYVMPIMMVFWFNDYSSALSYYYFLASLITLLQTWIIRKTIDEKALFERLQKKSENYKPKKNRSSSLLERLEKMQREQQRKLNRK